MWQRARCTGSTRRCSNFGGPIWTVPTSKWLSPQVSPWIWRRTKYTGLTSGTGKIQRADLDGSNVENVVTISGGGLECIALDIEEGKIYWIEDGVRAIRRANLDGFGVEDFVTSGIGNPEFIALDFESDKLYWTDWGSR